MRKPRFELISTMTLTIILWNGNDSGALMDGSFLGGMWHYIGHDHAHKEGIDLDSEDDWNFSIYEKYNNGSVVPFRYKDPEHDREL